MRSMKAYLVAFTAILLLAGCASGVKREGDTVATAGQALPKLPVADVTIRLSPQAQKLAAENPKFDQERLRQTVRRYLDVNQLLQPGAGATAEIVLTEFRVRSTFSAVMWGVMAGTDNVTGDVVVRDKSGRQLRKFSVNASYGLGGAMGGDDTRLNWLYDTFAEHTVAELGGPRKN